ncbi:hypothetical protein [Aeromonas phage ZPAH34]|uniref:hypothetical protein n=1 Tax=Aeromonas phage ZPAH34 TaxID=2924888 RepID=UPI0023292AA9|nr:hypothetical protein PQD16_gp051 [Aeromonas phage ZPAH34]UOX39632.1 hypothetical protein [Aeromonas phage ZPAH34]
MKKHFLIREGDEFPKELITYPLIPQTNKKVTITAGTDLYIKKDGDRWIAMPTSVKASGPLIKFSPNADQKYLDLIKKFTLIYNG